MTLTIEGYVPPLNIDDKKHKEKKKEMPKYSGPSWMIFLRKRLTRLECTQGVLKIVGEFSGDTGIMQSKAKLANWDFICEEINWEAIVGDWLLPTSASLPHSNQLNYALEAPIELIHRLMNIEQSISIWDLF